MSSSQKEEAKFTLPPGATFSPFNYSSSSVKTDEAADADGAGFPWRPVAIGLTSLLVVAMLSVIALVLIKAWHRRIEEKKNQQQADHNFFEVSNNDDSNLLISLFVFVRSQLALIRLGILTTVF